MDRERESPTSGGPLPLTTTKPPPPADAPSPATTLPWISGHSSPPALMPPSNIDSSQSGFPPNTTLASALSLQLLGDVQRTSKVHSPLLSCTVGSKMSMPGNPVKMEKISKALPQHSKLDLMQHKTKECISMLGPGKFFKSFAEAVRSGVASNLTEDPSHLGNGVSFNQHPVRSRHVQFNPQISVARFWKEDKPCQLHKVGCAGDIQRLGQRVKNMSYSKSRIFVTRNPRPSAEYPSFGISFGGWQKSNRSAKRRGTGGNT